LRATRAFVKTPTGEQRAPIGLVLETVGGAYRVRLQDEGEIEASLRGRVKHVRHPGRGRVVAGDRVLVSATESSSDWVIEDVCPRSSELVRAGPGGRKPKVVAANLDRALAVFSVSEPTFDLAAADRFLVLAESCGVTPVIVLNKMDLPGGAAVEEQVVAPYTSLGYRVFPTSARNRNLGPDGALRGGEVVDPECAFPRPEAPDGRGSAKEGTRPPYYRRIPSDPD
jgi:putative ribosome biogenesis GTPase RsgA